MILHRITLIIFLISGMSAFGQFYPGSPDSYRDAFGPIQPMQPTLNSNLGLQPVKFNLQTGASFNSGFGGGSLFNTFVAPSFSQPLGKKFTISAGAIIGNTTFSNTQMLNSEGQFSPVSGNLTTFTIFTSGAYQVNDRLTVSGSAYKTINPAFNPRMNPENLRMEAQGMSVGVGYRIGDNMHIGAEFRMNQGDGSFYQPHYGIPGTGMMHNGFYGY